MPSKLNAHALVDLAAQPGPCLTVLVPDQHPGSSEISQRVHLRTLVKAARERAPWPATFDAQMEEFAESLPENGRAAFAVYRAPDSVASVSVPGCAVAKSVFASHPYVMPLLEASFAAHDLFVLGLSTKHLRLLEYVDGVCHPVALPTTIPADLAAAGHFHHGSSVAQSATAAGPGHGGMGGIRFGTSGDRESTRDAMDHYCSLIDQGLRPILNGRPLLLMGVREEIAAYRRVSHCDSLIHTEVEGNADALTSAQVAKLAAKASLDEYQRLGAQVLNELKELRDRTRVAQGPRAVLQAAAEGRVHKVCVRSGTEMIGPMEAALDRANLPSEDLVNAAVVETLRHGGEVYLLPADQMPITESVSAILRY